MAKFNERLLIALQRSGLSQKELSDKTGLHKVKVNQYINGRCQPNNIEAILDIARLLNVSAPWLAGYDTPMEEHDLISCFKFKERLKEALNKKGMSENQLAATINFNEQNVKDWLQGKDLPDFDTILEICKVLNISMIWLLGCNVPMIDESEIYHLYENLNEEGKARVRQYINDLLDNPKFKKMEEPAAQKLA